MYSILRTAWIRKWAEIISENMRYIAIYVNAMMDWKCFKWNSGVLSVDKLEFRLHPGELFDGVPSNNAMEANFHYNVIFDLGNFMGKLHKWIFQNISASFVLSFYWESSVEVCIWIKIEIITLNSSDNLNFHFKRKKEVENLDK